MTTKQSKRYGALSNLMDRGAWCGWSKRVQRARRIRRRLVARSRRRR